MKCIKKTCADGFKKLIQPAQDEISIYIMSYKNGLYTKDPWKKFKKIRSLVIRFIYNHKVPRHLQYEYFCQHYIEWCYSIYTEAITRYNNMRGASFLNYLALLLSNRYLDKIRHYSRQGKFIISNFSICCISYLIRVYIIYD